MIFCGCSVTKRNDSIVCKQTNDSLMKNLDWKPNVSVRRHRVLEGNLSTTIRTMSGVTPADANADSSAGRAGTSLCFSFKSSNVHTVSTSERDAVQPHSLHRK